LFTDSTMGFITIFHHHLGEYLWFTFSVRIFYKQAASPRNIGGWKTDPFFSK